MVTADSWGMRAVAKGNALLDGGSFPFWFRTNSLRDTKKVKTATMGTRALARMVAEDDPGFARFWAIYPWRIAKLEARKAWAVLEPTPEMVERMLAALAWQAPLWAKQGYGMPYPASWLRGHRWEDEQPQRHRGRDVICPHTPKCATEGDCWMKTIGWRQEARHDR